MIDPERNNGDFDFFTASLCSLLAISVALFLALAGGSPHETEADVLASSTQSSADHQASDPATDGATQLAEDREATAEIDVPGDEDAVANLTDGS